MRLVLTSLILLLLGTVLMVIGANLIKRTKYEKQGSILVKIGWVVFLVIVYSWAAYGETRL